MTACVGWPVWDLNSNRRGVAEAALRWREGRFPLAAEPCSSLHPSIMIMMMSTAIIIINVIAFFHFIDDCHVFIYQFFLVIIIV